MEIFITLLFCVTGIIITAMIQFKKGKLLQSEKIMDDKAGEINKREKLFIEVYGGLTFQEFMSPSISSEKVASSTISFLNSKIGDLGNQCIQTVRLINDKKYILAKYPTHIATQISKGTVTEVITKSGEKILMARNSATGKIVVHARKAESASKFNNLASASNLIFGAAHLLSGYDNAKKLGGLVKDVAKILQHRNNDMLAELEAIFEEMQELSYGDTPDKSFLKSLKHELKILRNKWFNEVLSALNNIEDPKNKPALERWFTFKSTLKKKYDIDEEVSLAPLHIIRRSLELERSLSIALGEEEAFINLTLKSQYEKVNKLKELIHEKRTAIENFTGRKFLTNAKDGFTLDANNYSNSLEVESVDYDDLDSKPKAG